MADLGVKKIINHLDESDEAPTDRIRFFEDEHFSPPPVRPLGHMNNHLNNNNQQLHQQQQPFPNNYLPVQRQVNDPMQIAVTQLPSSQASVAASSNKHLPHQQYQQIQVQGQPIFAQTGSNKIKSQESQSDLNQLTQEITIHAQEMPFFEVSSKALGLLSIVDVAAAPGTVLLKGASPVDGAGGIINTSQSNATHQFGNQQRESENTDLDFNKHTNKYFGRHEAMSFGNVDFTMLSKKSISSNSVHLGPLYSEDIITDQQNGMLVGSYRATSNDQQLSAKVKRSEPYGLPIHPGMIQLAFSQRQQMDTVGHDALHGGGGGGREGEIIIAPSYYQNRPQSKEHQVSSKQITPRSQINFNMGNEIKASQSAGFQNWDMLNSKMPIHNASKTCISTVDYENRGRTAELQEKARWDNNFKVQREGVEFASREPFRRSSHSPADNNLSTDKLYNASIVNNQNELRNSNNIFKSNDRSRQSDLYKQNNDGRLMKVFNMNLPEIKPHSQQEIQQQNSYKVLNNFTLSQPHIPAHIDYPYLLQPSSKGARIGEGVPNMKGENRDQITFAQQSNFYGKQNEDSQQLFHNKSSTAFDDSQLAAPFIGMQIHQNNKSDQLGNSGVNGLEEMKLGKNDLKFPYEDSSISKTSSIEENQTFCYVRKRPSVRKSITPKPALKEASNMLPGFELENGPRMLINSQKPGTFQGLRTIFQRKEDGNISVQADNGQEIVNQSFKQQSTSRFQKGQTDLSESKEYDEKGGAAKEPSTQLKQIPEIAIEETDDDDEDEDRLKKLDKEATQKTQKAELRTEIDLVALMARKFAKNKFQRRRCILYPEQGFHIFWDILIGLFIGMSCLTTPIFLAFPERYGKGMMYFDNSTNIIFFIDIIANFITVYHDEDFRIVDNYKEIGMRYIKSWFFVDLVSCIPIDWIFEIASVNKVTRVSRLGKLYKVVRLTRLARIIKTLKMRTKLAKNFTEILKISLGIERILLMVISFLMLQHIAACVWIFIGRFDEASKDTWIVQEGYLDQNDAALYITSVYFSVTTTLTVGYGDVTACTMSEKLFCVFLMIIGVLSFSYATGALSTIIQSLDSKEAQLKQKIATLNEIKDEYGVDNRLFNKLARTVQYDHRKRNKDKSEFLEELPHKLKLELVVLIHRKMYQQIDFFKGKGQNFIAWIATILKTINYEEKEYIYKEGEECSEIYFILKGQVAYVLPRFHNLVYKFINKGSHFGHLEIGGQKRLFGETDRRKAQKLKKSMANPVRRFTVQALDQTELLVLPINDLFVMKAEFPDVFDELFHDLREQARQDLHFKMEVIKKNEIEFVKAHNHEGGALQAHVAIHIMGDLQNKILMQQQTRMSTPYDKIQASILEKNTVLSKNLTKLTRGSLLSGLGGGLLGSSQTQNLQNKLSYIQNGGLSSVNPQKSDDKKSVNANLKGEPTRKDSDQLENDSICTDEEFKESQLNGQRISASDRSAPAVVQQKAQQKFGHLTEQELLSINTQIKDLYGEKDEEDFVDDHSHIDDSEWRKKMEENMFKNMESQEHLKVMINNVMLMQQNVLKELNEQKKKMARFARNGRRGTGSRRN